MAVNNIMDLCRICGKLNEYSKDLLDENNKHILDLLKDYTQLSISALDNMPTKICLDCEEKLVSFQLFILECYKTQDSLRRMVVGDYSVKIEDLDLRAVIKSEVKDELTPDDILGGFTNDGVIANNYDDNSYCDDDNDHLDDLTIASLKKIKDDEFESDLTEIEAIDKIITREELDELNKILKKPNLKTKDLVLMICEICKEVCPSWTILYTHYAKEHNSKPLVYCKCGISIRSNRQLLLHVSEHQGESKKVRKSIVAKKRKHREDIRKRESGDNTESGGDSELLESKVKRGPYKMFNVKDYVNFICNTCQKECTSWYDLQSHSESYHKVPPVVKCKCETVIKSKSVLYKHVRDHNTPNELSCDICSLVAKSKAGLEKHKLKHIPRAERKFACSSCDKVYKHKDALKSHERIHIPIEERKVYHCDICDLRFTTRSSAMSHKRIVHQKIKSYVCDLCGYACGTNGELRQHRAIHSDDKPFVCNICSKSFKTYSNLKTHTDTHAQTSYQCYLCNRILNSRRTLRKHLLVHEDKCGHVCNYCNKAFKRRQTLKVHMYTHTGDKPLSCQWCDERFSYASTLRSHRMRCHPEKLSLNQPTYSNCYNHIPPEEYIKNDLAAINVAKNEVEAM